MNRSVSKPDQDSCVPVFPVLGSGCQTRTWFMYNVFSVHTLALGITLIGQLHIRLELEKIEVPSSGS